MTDMAEVLDEHVQSARNRRCSCGWRGDVSKSIIDRENIYWQHRRHVAAALAAAGFGSIRTDEQRLMLAAVLAYDAIEASALEQARAEAWDEGYTIGNAHNGRRDANPYRVTDERGGE